MKALLRSLVCSTVLSLVPAGAQPASPTNASPWWYDQPRSRPYTNDAKRLPRIRVQGNRFVDPAGNTMLFRGLSISDPDKIERQGHWTKGHFEQVKAMGARVVRIPVHPVAWRLRGPAGYLQLLDQAVQWCTELELYVMIDWHTIGNLKMELFQDPMYDTTQKETFEFWRQIARRYRGNHTVAFYELFNEPTTYRGELGRMTWSEWKKLNEDMIHLIRAYDTEAIPLVAGFDWAYDLTPLLIEPIEADGIGYVTHPYSNKRSKPWEPKWEENFGFAAARYPVVATEFGIFSGRSPSDPDYGPRIIDFLESHGISWLCWCFDPEWGPTLIKSWKYDLTASGEFFKNRMQQAPAKP